MDRGWIKVDRGWLKVDRECLKVLLAIQKNLLVLYADVFLPVRNGLVNKVEILGPNTRM